MEVSKTTFEEPKDNVEGSPSENQASTPKHRQTSVSRTRSAFFDRTSPVAVDIGGSFTKLVYWRPPNPPEMPDYIIKEFQDDAINFKFPLKPDPTLKLSLKIDDHQADLKFLKFPSSRTVEFCQFVLDHKLHETYGPEKTKTVNATGGGAFKYANLVKEKLGVTFNKHDEMKCLIDGLNFLLLNVDNEAFTYDWKTKEQHFISCEKSKNGDPNFPFPYLLVNIGSGVSVLKVDDQSFERISGSSLGGGTFWGLCKMLTDIKSFDEVKALSEKGDNKMVDLVVGDIYGSDLGTLGLSADVIASSLGKIGTARIEEQKPPQSEDIVRSLLFMISNNIAQIGYLNAKLHNIQRIYFSGGFLQENAYVWSRFSYAVDFWSHGEMQAHFLHHNSYLGALGALLQH